MKTLASGLDAHGCTPVDAARSDARHTTAAAEDPSTRTAARRGAAITETDPHTQKHRARRRTQNKMIKGIIIVNNSGQARICKFFQQVHREGYSPEEAQQSVVQQVYKQVSERPDSFCNYLEGSIMQWGDDTKLIYRHYATLYFVFAVDKLESDLGILDLIQVFVEALDKCFENVCELDLIFHSDKVHYILDEIVMAGMVLETNIVTILQGVNDQTKLHQKSTSKLNEALGKATSTKMGSPGVR